MAARKGEAILLLVLALCLAPWHAVRAGSEGETGNVITGVRVESGEESTRVILVGREVPTFNVFKLIQPDRLVVDMPATRLSGVEKTIGSSDPRIGEITASEFTQAGSLVSRISIGLKPGNRFDARAEGSNIVITIGSPGAERTASAAPAPAPAANPASAPTPAANPAPAAPVVSAAPEPQESPAETPATAADFRVVESIGDRGRAGSVAVDRVQAQKNGVVDIVTRGEIKAYEVLEVFGPDRLVLDIYGGTMKGKVRESSLSSPAVNRARLARHPDKVRVVLDYAEGKARPFKVEKTRQGLRIAFPKPETAQEPAVAAKAMAAPAAPTPEPQPAPQPKAAPTANPPPAVAAAPAAAAIAAEAAQSAKPAGSLRDLTFRQEGGEARVVLEMKGEVQPQVVHTDDQSAVLEIADCSLPVTLERTLDVSEFGTPLRSVSAYRVPGEGKVKIVAATSGVLTSRLERREGAVHWVFEIASVTASADAAADPAASEAAPTEYTYAPDEVAGYSVREPAMAEGGGGGAKKAKYTGRRISMDFKDADIHNVLRMISEVAKLNIITSDDVQGKVTITLRNVPWDQALDIILKTKHLGKVRHGNIIRIAKQDDLIKEQKDAAEIQEKMKPLEPLRVRIISVNYAQAGDIEKQVKNVLSDRGEVTVDTRTNVLIIKDVLENLVKAEGLVRSLDTETPQVLIEARIVEANAFYLREVGIQWGPEINFDASHGNPTGLPFPGDIRIRGGADDSTTNTDLSGTGNPGRFAVNLPAAVGSGAGGAIGFVFGSAGGAAALNLRLTAAENKGEVKIISAPKIATLDNHKAKIGQGVSIPISVTSAAGVNTIFVEAKLELEVTPHITQEGSILMAIKVTKNEPDFSRTGAKGDPTILKKEAETQVMVRDGDTTVIGGIYTRKTSDTFIGVPVLSRIPILGYFFRSTKYNDDRTELLIFITPRIVNRLQATVTQK